MSRCGARQSEDLGPSDDALDGILGFGKSNSSMLSQLASSGRVKKMFAHCLDGVNGGGIFAIGHVVQPQVNTTPLVPNQYVQFIDSNCVTLLLAFHYGSIFREMFFYTWIILLDYQVGFC